MAKRQHSIDYGALAPFGRLGYQLGWRWVFFFTFPIPFHPGLFRALPFAVGAWLLWLAVGDREVEWHSPLIAALILAVPLSVPIFQWILFAFRIHLIQAAMVPAALLLLAYAAARGQASAWVVIAPILFFGGHAVAALRGRRRIAEWLADDAAVDAVPARAGPPPPLLLRGAPSIRYTAQNLLTKLDLPAIHFEDGQGCHLLLRVEDEGLAERLKTLRRAGIDAAHISKGQGMRFVTLHDRAPPDAVVIESLGPPAGMAFLHGKVGTVRALAPDQPPLPYHYGRPAPFSWFPGFYFFMRLQLGSTARYAPQVGMVPAREQPLGKAYGADEAYAALANALRTDAEPPRPLADPAPLRSRVEALVDARLAPDLAALERLIEAPGQWMRRSMETLLKLPESYAARAPELVVALRAARDAEHVEAAIILARLIAALPADAYQGIGSALLELLNSKALAGRLVYDDPPDPSRPARFEGFRLLVHVPDLYGRLGTLGERARPLINAMIALFPQVEILKAARDTIDAGTPPET